MVTKVLVRTSGGGVALLLLLASAVAQAQAVPRKAIPACDRKECVRFTTREQNPGDTRHRRLGVTATNGCADRVEVAVCFEDQKVPTATCGAISLQPGEKKEFFKTRYTGRYVSWAYHGSSKPCADMLLVKRCEDGESFAVCGERAR